MSPMLQGAQHFGAAVWRYFAQRDFVRRRDHFGAAGAADPRRRWRRFTRVPSGRRADRRQRGGHVVVVVGGGIGWLVAILV